MIKNKSMQSTIFQSPGQEWVQAWLNVLSVHSWIWVFIEVRNISQTFHNWHIAWFNFFLYQVIPAEIVEPSVAFNVIYTLN